MRPRPLPTLLPLLLLAACGPETSPRGTPPTEADESGALLTAGEILARPIEGGEVHGFDLELASGDFLHVVAEQRGVDLILRLRDPSGRLLLEVDSPTGTQGPETLHALAAAGGRHRLELESFGGGAGGEGGRYELRVEALRPASETDRWIARAAAAFARGEALAGEDPGAALPHYLEARELYARAAHARGEGEALHRSALCQRRRGRPEEAEGLFREAEARFAEVGDSRWRAIQQQQIGRLHFEKGDSTSLASARRHFRRAELLAQEAGDLVGRGEALYNLAHTSQRLGEPQEALELYRRSLELEERRGDPSRLSDKHHNLGTLLQTLGQPRRALDHLREAARLLEGLDDPTSLAITLDTLGQVHLALGELAEAEGYFHRALTLHEPGSRGEAVVLSDLGQLAQAKGEVEEAVRLQEEALALFRRLGDFRAEASVLQNLGARARQLGRPEEAARRYREALALHRRAGAPREEAETLAGLARAERQAGRLEEARRLLLASLELYESFRYRVSEQSRRATFLATVQPVYEELVDLTMERHRLMPGAGHDAEALAASERARARSLLELLARSGADPLADIEPALSAEKEALSTALERAEARRLAASRQGGPALAEAQRELRRAVDRLRRLEGKLRAASPAYAGLTQPRPLPPEAVRRRVLDPETSLLQIHLGRERSFLWLLGPRGLTSRELPPREALEALARRAHETLQRSHRPEGRSAADRALCALSRELLAPIAGHLRGQRLAVAAEGALLYVPFAALPHPRSLADCARAEPLAAEHEVVSLASASALAVQRSTLAGRAPSLGALAILADPIFEAGDERLPAAPRGESVELAALRFRRLTHTRREAEAILALAAELPGPEPFVALGLAARREAVVGPRLAGYRILHFATHGVLDDEHPELSGLVLSRLDGRGRPLEGMLRAHELYGLKLSAELVVLSACRTALGAEIRGEGLVGLTQGFLHAGARRVLVSLWSVADRGTAELMEAFYRALWREGLAPAAALRRAQLEIRARAGYEAPYFWAPFLLHGDWR